MKILNNLIIIFCIICVSSCKEGMDKKIGNYIKSNFTINNENDSCTIDIKDILDVNWDTIYIFPSWSMSEDISDILGMKYDGNYVKDDTERIIFIRNHKIIKEEDWSVWSKYRIVFSYTDWPSQIRKYSTSKFIVKKIRGEHSYFYKLDPVCANL